MSTTLTRLLGLCLLVFLSTGLNTLARAAERVTWYHHDLQGSPVAATDRNGEVVWREQYKPYGQRTLKEDGGSNKLWYTGKAHEEGTRLSYYGARWYHPEIGRFMSVDPVDFTEDNVQSFNRYAYANNNPYRYVDPDGMAPWDLDAAKRVASGFNLDAGFGPGMGPGGRGGGVGEKSISAIQAERNQIIANESARIANGIKGETGSYTNTHASGRTYDGKGSRERSQASGRRVEQETGDQHVATEWRPAPTQRDAFKDESRRLDSHGGPSDAGNYNRIESPGKRYRAEDGS